MVVLGSRHVEAGVGSFCGKRPGGFVARAIVDAAEEDGYDASGGEVVLVSEKWL